MVPTAFSLKSQIRSDIDFVDNLYLFHLLSWNCLSLFPIVKMRQFNFIETYLLKVEIYIVDSFIIEVALLMNLQTHK